MQKFWSVSFICLNWWSYGTIAFLHIKNNNNSVRTSSSSSSSSQQYTSWSHPPTTASTTTTTSAVASTTTASDSNSSPRKKFSFLPSTQRLTKRNAYLLLLASIALECTGASLSKRSRDIRSFVLFGVACLLNMTSMFGLNIVLSRIAVGTAYAAWGAIGTIFVTTVGVIIFQEPWSFMKALYLSMIATGVIGLNLSHS